MSNQTTIIKVTGIGLRVVSGNEVYFCVVEKDLNDQFIWRVLDTIRVPLSLEPPEQFSYVRNTLMDIFQLYDVTRAAIRIPEFSQQGLKQSMIDRLYLEGVIQESIAGSKIDKHIAGRVAKLSKFLDFKATEFRRYANNELTFEKIPVEVDWAGLKVEKRESVLACYASLGL